MRRLALRKFGEVVRFAAAPRRPALALGWRVHLIELRGQRANLAAHLSIVAERSDSAR